MMISASNGTTADAINFNPSNEHCQNLLETSVQMYCMMLIEGVYRCLD